MMYRVQPVTNQERIERMHLFWSVWGMHCCSILAWQRISAYDDQKDFPITLNKVSGPGFFPPVFPGRRHKPELIACTQPLSAGPLIGFKVYHLSRFLGRQGHCTVGYTGSFRVSPSCLPTPRSLPLIRSSP